MLYTKSIVIPAGTLETAPYEEELILLGGYIIQLDIRIPPGHAGKAKIKVLDSEVQLYPVNAEEAIKGDDELHSIQDKYKIERPFRLIFRGWNDDTENDHEFIFYINMMTESQVKGGTTNKTFILNAQKERQGFISSLMQFLFG